MRARLGRQVQRYRCARTLVCAVLVVLAVPAAVAGAATGELRLERVRHSLLGTHRIYVQTYRGLPVVDGFLARHEYRGATAQVSDGRHALHGVVPVRPAVSAPAAQSAARVAVAAPGAPAPATLSIWPGDPSRLVWSVVVAKATGRERVLVDAVRGGVIRTDRLALDATGSGRVFDPNPVVTLRDQSLRDQGDADYPALAAAYRTVPLTHLDGSGFLRGDFARIAYDNAHTAFSPSLAFAFNRSSTFFSQTVAYHQATRAQEELQRLGFTDVNNHPQELAPDGFSEDNSFFDGTTIVLGTGGVDDAEDADIIWHEYGHAIQFDQFSPTADFRGDVASGAIGEGFSDYWAVTMSETVNGTYDLPCVGDWNGVAGNFGDPRCLRRVDTNMTIADRTFEAHTDGQIWSRALWDINRALGRDVANRIIIEAQFGFDYGISFTRAARTTVDVAQKLYGSKARKVAEAAFTARGISLHPEHPIHPDHPVHPVRATVLATLGAPAPNGGALDFAFEFGDLNRSGAFSFAANLADGPDQIGQGVFVADGSGLVEVARSGDPAPGGGTLGFGIVGRPALNDAGDVAFGFIRDPFALPFGVNAGLYRRSGTTGPLAPLVIPGGTFEGAIEAELNSAGDVAFTGITQTSAGYWPDLGSGVYRTGPGITPVAAPGASIFDFAANASINQAGDTAFIGHVAGDPLDFCAPPEAGFIDCLGDVFLRRANGTLAAVARHGESVAGLPPLVVATAPVLNDRGDVAFWGGFDGLGPALVVQSSDGAHVIAAEGQPMPGGGQLSLPLSFRTIHHPVALDGAGRAAFAGNLSDGAGVFLWDAGRLSEVARTGAALSNGGGIIAEIRTDAVALNDRGQVVFWARLTDGREVLLRVNAA
jgi:hypothetical protein